MDWIGRMILRMTRSVVEGIVVVPGGQAPVLLISSLPFFIESPSHHSNRIGACVLMCMSFQGYQWIS